MQSCPYWFQDEHDHAQISIRQCRRYTIKRRIGFGLDVEFRAHWQVNILAIDECTANDADRAKDYDAGQAGTSGHCQILHFLCGLFTHEGIHIRAID